LLWIKLQQDAGEGRHELGHSWRRVQFQRGGNGPASSKSLVTQSIRKA
jgi:hypothetical protein